MGNEMEKDNIIKTSPGDDDLMLPEGYGAEDDLFADPKTWTGKQADESAEESAAGEDGKGDGAEDPAPATEQDPAQDVSDNDTAAAPATEPTAPANEQNAEKSTSNMFKFRVKHDREERDVELNESELPELWQRAQNHDRMQSRFNEQQTLIGELDAMARMMGYANARDMKDKAAGAYRDAEIKSMTDTGVPERIAKAVVAQEMQSRSAAPAAAPQTPPPAQAAPVRNPQAEVAELLAAKPELYGKQIPQEVFVASAVGGKSLLAAYTEYEAAKSRSEAEKLRTENNIHKQNAANAAKAPVKGVSAGGAAKDKNGEDDFLRGFNSDD